MSERIYSELLSVLREIVELNDEYASAMYTLNADASPFEATYCCPTREEVDRASNVVSEYYEKSCNIQEKARKLIIACEQNQQF